MTDSIKYQNVDMVLNLFYGHLPYGVNYFTLTTKCKFPEEERHHIFDFLIREKLIQKFGTDFKYIISEKGIDAVKMNCGIEKYIETLKIID